MKDCILACIFLLYCLVDSSTIDNKLFFFMEIFHHYFGSMWKMEYLVPYMAHMLGSAC